MHVCRFNVGSGSDSQVGLVDPEEGTVTEIEGLDAPTENFLREGADLETLQAAAGGETHSLDDVRLRAPIERPTNLIGIGLNYAGHAEEGGYDIPDEPIFFAKSPSSINDPDGDIVRHDGVTNLHYEGEFGIVIGETASGVDADEAADCVFGYTVANDVTARDTQLDDLDEANPWYRSKSMDTFTPLGPWITPVGKGVDPENASIETRLNGETVQSSSTSDLIFPVPEVVSYVSQYVTLQPGDVVITGTPAGVGELEVGDEVVVEVEGVGALENQVTES